MGQRENDDMQGRVSALLKKQDNRDERTTPCWLEERCVEE